MLLYLSIFRRELLTQTTALYYTGRLSMTPDAKRFHAVPNGRSDSRSSMLHPAAPPPTFGPLAKWPVPWFNAGTQRTTQTDSRKRGACLNNTIRYPNMGTVKRAAEIYGLSPSYIRRLCKTGKIRYVNAGHMWLVNLDSLARYFEQGDPAPAEQSQTARRRGVTH